MRCDVKDQQLLSLSMANVSWYLFSILVQFFHCTMVFNLRSDLFIQDAQDNTKRILLPRLKCLIRLFGVTEQEQNQSGKVSNGALVYSSDRSSFAITRQLAATRTNWNSAE